MPRFGANLTAHALMVDHYWGISDRLCTAIVRERNNFSRQIHRLKNL